MMLDDEDVDVYEDDDDDGSYYPPSVIVHVTLPAK